jgi:DNA-binding XRE family transcriptional regulator
MNIPIPNDHQVVKHKGKPVAVVVPWAEYLALIPPPRTQPTTPHEVVEKFFGEGKSLIRSWREYLNLTQEEAASRLDMKQSSYQQIEKKSAKPRTATLEKIAAAFGIETSLLTWDDE